MVNGNITKLRIKGKRRTKEITKLNLKLVKIQTPKINCKLLDFSPHFLRLWKFSFDLSLSEWRIFVQFYFCFQIRCVWAAVAQSELEMEWV